MPFAFSISLRVDSSASREAPGHLGYDPVPGVMSISMIASHSVPCSSVMLLMTSICHTPPPQC